MTRTCGDKFIAVKFKTLAYARLRCQVGLCGIRTHMTVFNRDCVSRVDICQLPMYEVPEPQGREAKGHSKVQVLGTNVVTKFVHLLIKRK